MVVAPPAAGLNASRRPAADQPFQRLLYLFDRDCGPANRLIPRWLFLRGLGLVYFSAFLALKFQILGMIGSLGIMTSPEYF